MELSTIQHEIVNVKKLMKLKDRIPFKKWKVLKYDGRPVRSINSNCPFNIKTDRKIS